MISQHMEVDHINETDSENILNYINEYWQVNIGQITSVNLDGSVKVQGYKTFNNVRIEWDHVELIRIGNALGSVNTNLAGSLCLLFRPREVMLNASTREVDFGAGAFGRGGIKGLVISTGSEDIIKHGIDSAGSWYFQTDVYKVIFSNKTFGIWRGGICVCTLSEKALVFQPNKSYSETYSSNGVCTYTWYNADSTIAYSRTYTLDTSAGMLEKIFDKDGNEIIAITASTDGYSVAVGTCSVNIGTDEVTVSAGNSNITLAKDGACTINGHLEVSA